MHKRGTVPTRRLILLVLLASLASTAGASFTNSLDGKRLEHRQSDPHAAVSLSNHASQVAPAHGAGVDNWSAGSHGTRTGALTMIVTHHRHSGWTVDAFVEAFQPAEEQSLEKVPRGHPESHYYRLSSMLLEAMY